MSLLSDHRQPTDNENNEDEFSPADSQDCAQVDCWNINAPKIMLFNCKCVQSLLCFFQIGFWITVCFGLNWYQCQEAILKLLINQHADHEHLHSVYKYHYSSQWDTIWFSTLTNNNILARSSNIHHTFEANYVNTSKTIAEQHQYEPCYHNTSEKFLVLWWLGIFQIRSAFIGPSLGVVFD